ncbi:MAG: hypothetical protein KIT31_01695 [Deltaproteobacteria bacterium]|nr:hypothetical protein [Deltaproteobacteria bacterium]
MSLDYKLVSACLVAASACADPAVEVVLSGERPGNLNTACADAVSMRVFGTNYASDKNDFRYSCRELPSSLATAADIKRAITGLFDIEIPRSGLGGVQLEAMTGGCPIGLPADLRSAEIMFTASARYRGDGSINLPIIPIASCESKTHTARAIDIFKLTATKDCAQAVFPDGAASISFGQLAPTLFDGTMLWSSFFDSTPWAGGVGSGPGLYNVGDVVSCMAADVGNNTTWSVSCVEVGPTVPRVCATGSEIEVGVADMTPVFNSIASASRYRSFVVGSVWTGAGAARTPASGVVVEADPKHSEVFYVEPGAGNTLTVLSGATSTSDKGMFVLFMDSVMKVKVKSARAEREVTMGADVRFPGVALIQLQ